MFKIFQYGAVLLLIVLAALAYGRSQNALYKLLRRIKLGVYPLWEFMAVDPLRRRLLLSQDLMLLVIDMDKDEIVAAIDFPAAVHGIALAEPIGRGFVCHRSDNAISVFDLQRLEVTGRMEGIVAQPENILYDPHSGHLFVFNSRSRFLTVINPLREMVTAVIPLPGQPVWAACNGTGQLFVSLSHTDELLQIDTVACSIIKQWAPLPGEAPGGIAFDNSQQVFFCACDGRLVIIDAKDLTELAVIPIGNYPGAIVYDSATSLLYTANGEGNLTIIKQLQRHEYKVMQTIGTQAGCRSMAIDPITKKLYLPAVKYLSPRKPAPGSFELLVFGMNTH